MLVKPQQASTDERGLQDGGEAYKQSISGVIERSYGVSGKKECCVCTPPHIRVRLHPFSIRVRLILYNMLVRLRQGNAR